MKKNKLFLLVLLAAIFAVCLIGIKVKAQEPLSEPMVGDPLENYAIKDEVKGIFKKILEFWGPINEKGKEWWKGLAEPHLKEWLKSRKTAIQQGWEEEKRELRESLSKSLKEWFFNIKEKLWDKIKEKIKAIFS